jgi:hypothetical protein
MNAIAFEDVKTLYKERTKYIMGEGQSLHHTQMALYFCLQFCVYSMGNNKPQNVPKWQHDKQKLF